MTTRMRNMMAAVVATVLGVPLVAQQPAADAQGQPAATKRVIVVSLEDRELALVVDGQVKKVYPVAVGKPSTPSPVGTFTIARRVMNPTYSATTAAWFFRGHEQIRWARGGWSPEHFRLRNSRNQCAELDREGCVAWMHSPGEKRSGRTLPNGRSG